MIPLPAYVDKDAWDGFVSMRQAMGKTKPFTTRAATLILYELQRIKDAGHCPNAALDQSVLRGWADVWPAKDKPIERAITSAAEQTRKEADARVLTAEERAASEEARRRVMASIGKGIRRVA